jgi:hypothetical protein
MWRSGCRLNIAVAASFVWRCLSGSAVAPFPHPGLHTRAVTVYRDTLSEGFSHFVTSMTAPVASGWSVCRWDLHPLESAAFSRRTPRTDITPEIERWERVTTVIFRHTPLRGNLVVFRH